MAVPDDVLLAGWAPFGAACLLCVCVSWVYLWRLSLWREREPLALACGTLSLAASLAAAALLPADVSLASAMKDPNGTFLPWATNASDRTALQWEVQLAYYALYGALVLLAFVVLPFAYFYSEEKDDTLETGACRRAVSALKYTILFLLVAGVLLTIGAVIPLRQLPASNSTEWDKIKFLVDELAASRGEDSLSFLLSLFVLVGLVLVIVYTGFGLSALPLRLIMGERSAAKEAADVGHRRQAVRTQLEALARHGSSGGGPRQQTAGLDGAALEEQLRALEERQRRLDQFRGSCLYKMRCLYRPLQILVGVVCAVLGLLLWTSLMLANVDKSMHSMGFRMGYLLRNPQLPNPLDWSLVFLQRWGASLLDSGLVLALVLQLVACSAYGLQRIGIWCLFIPMYRLRMGRSRPQALLLLCLGLVFVALALNVVLYSACPQYATFGSQRYQDINGTHPCSLDLNVPENECVMSRASAFLARFFFKAWVFGAIYFWATWLFLVSTLLSLFIIIMRGRQSSVEVDSDDLDDDSDDVALVRA